MFSRFLPLRALPPAFLFPQLASEERNTALAADADSCSGESRAGTKSAMGGGDAYAADLFGAAPVEQACAPGSTHSCLHCPVLTSSRKNSRGGRLRGCVLRLGRILRIFIADDRHFWPRCQPAHVSNLLQGKLLKLWRQESEVIQQLALFACQVIV